MSMIDKILAYDDNDLKKQFGIMAYVSRGKGSEIWNDTLTWDEALMCVYSELGSRDISIED